MPHPKPNSINLRGETADRLIGRKMISIFKKKCGNSLGTLICRTKRIVTLDYYKCVMSPCDNTVKYVFSLDLLLRIDYR